MLVFAVFLIFAMNNNQQGNGTNNSGDSPLQIQGATLYQEKCSGCHNQLDSSTKRGHSASEIQEAINNVAPMKALSDLTTEEIQAIAEALKS